MSVNCPITVQFQVDKPDVLEEVGLRHHNTMMRRDRQEGAYNADAARFLRYVVQGKGVANGPRGDMFTWGSVGNYTMIESFVGALRPFWEELYRESALWDFVGILVMSQTEQRAHSTIVEISKDRTTPRSELSLIVRSRDTPFPLFEGFIERPEKLLPPDVHTTVWEKNGNVLMSLTEKTLDEYGF